MVQETQRDVRAMAKAALDGDAEDRAWLGEHPEEWHGALVDIKADLDRQMVQRKAALDVTHTDCLRRGDDGRDTYFAAKRDYETWRGRVLYFKNIVETEIRHIKPLRRAAQARAYLEEATALPEGMAVGLKVAGVTQRIGNVHAALQSLVVQVHDLEARVQFLESRDMRR